MKANQISSPLVWKEVEKERILIGKVLSNIIYTRSAMELILSKAWNLQEGLDVIEIDGNAFMFKFADGEEYNRILRGRPWSINGYVLNLLERSKYRSCEEYDFNRCLVWVQMHNIPMEAMCLENVVTIGGYVGEVMMAEDPNYNGRYLRGFLRARILLDLRKPLAYGFWLPRPNDVDIWILIRYEKLQSFCYSCGKILHDNRNCGSKKLMSVLNPKEPRFGTWLTTKLCRSWDEFVVVIKQDWPEAEHARRKRLEEVARRNAETRGAAETYALRDEEDLFFIKVNKAGGEYNESSWQKEVCSDAPLSRKVFNGPSLVVECKQQKHRDEGNLRSGEEPLKSDSKKDSNAEVDSDVASAGSKENSGGCSGRFSENLFANPLAMVVYSGRSLGEVIKGIGNLGLKREAAKEWEASTPKRRRKLEASPCSKPAISVFTENLRKTKAKSCRYAKRKGMKGKENILVDDGAVDDQMELSVKPNVEESRFVFKAGRGRGRKSVVVGSGGWPLSATQGP